MKIIGFAGKAGAGKDFLADLLVAHHGFAKVSLADHIKRICKEVFDFTDDQLWGPSQKRNEPDARYPRDHGPWTSVALIGHCMCCGLSREKARNERCYLTPRLALQLLGTEWGRHCYHDIWIEGLIKTAGLIAAGQLYSRAAGTGLGVTRSETGGVVVPDVRFDNEAETIRRAGGRVYLIYRQGSGLEGVAGSHVSETGLSRKLLSAVINNDPDVPPETTLTVLKEIAR